MIFDAMSSGNTMIFSGSDSTLRGFAAIQKRAGGALKMNLLLSIDNLAKFPVKRQLYTREEENNFSCSKLFFLGIELQFVFAEVTVSRRDVWEGRV